MKKIHIDTMLLATFCATLLYSMSYPYVHRVVMTGITDRAIAIINIVDCVSVIVMSTLWNKWGHRLFRYYVHLCVLEAIGSITTTVYVLLTDDIMTMYVADALVMAFVTRNIVCGGTKLRALRYPNKKLRERFDNNNNSIHSLATIIGSSLAIFLQLPFKWACIVGTIGNCVDNVFYVVIWFQTKDKEEEDEEE